REAIRAARKAFDEGIWPTLAAHKRGELVYQIGTLIRRDLQELAELETLDTGKTFQESLDDMSDISDVFIYFGGLADINEGDMIQSQIPHSESKIGRAPVGACVLTTPWHYPLLQAGWKIAPALSAGNTMLITPSEITPLTSV